MVLREVFILRGCNCDSEHRGVLSAQVVCVGSMLELEELTGVKVTDLHRER